MTKAHPLQWPDGWPRTPSHKRGDGGKFKRRSRQRPSINNTRRELANDLRLLGARNVVLSTNVELRLDGQLYSNRFTPADPGIAVYFSLGGDPMVMAQDAFKYVPDNIRSLTIAISGMRQMQRHGGGAMLKRTFSGFTALPPPDAMITPPPMAKQWRQVLEVYQGSPLDICNAVYEALARKASEAEMYDLNAAITGAITGARDLK